MSLNLFSGDPKIFVNRNGAYLDWRGGQCVMDAGLENTALFLLLIEPDWPGNYLFDNQDHEVGKGRFLEVVNQPITALSLLDAEAAAEQALEPMKTWGLASDISAEVTNPEGQEIRTTIEITPPDRDPVVLVGLRNGVNWIWQIKDPAYRRFE